MYIIIASIFIGVLLYIAIGVALAAIYSRRRNGIIRDRVVNEKTSIMLISLLWIILLPCYLYIELVKYIYDSARRWNE